MRISDWSSDVCSSDLALFAVAVVHARGDAICEQLAGLAGDAAFGLLAPARVVDVRVDVAEEAVFRRLQVVPGGFGHLLDELDFHDRLDALEAVLPRHHQPQRSEEHTYELQSLMRISYAVLCLKKKKQKHKIRS